MQSIPHTEATSYAVNGNGEGGRKKRNYCRAAEHFERPRVSCTKYVAQTAEAASLASMSEKPPE